jgi:hypothetical protein
MFHKTNSVEIQAKTPREQIIYCLKKLIGCGKLSNSADSIMYYASDLLEKPNTLSQDELNIFLVGTLFTAFVQADFKYESLANIPKNFDQRTRDLIWVTLQPLCPNDIETQIKTVGEMILKHKIIPFDGVVFSNIPEVQKIIKSNLLFLDDRYFEKYGIKPSVTSGMSHTV